MGKTRFSVMLDPEHLQFLEEMVRRGEAETLGQAIRKCINFYQDYTEKKGLILYSKSDVP